MDDSRAGTDPRAPKTPRAHRRRRVVAVRALAALAGLALLTGWARLAAPSLDALVSRELRRGMAAALEGFEGRWRLGGARFVPVQGIRLKDVTLTTDRGVQVSAPEVAVGVDLPSVLWRLAAPQQAVRHVEAQGIVIRPLPEKPPGTEPANGPPAGDLRELAGAVREAVAQLVAVLRGWPAGLGLGQEGLTWRLEGVWQQEPDGPGRRFWTEGRVEVAPGGRVLAEGTLRLEEGPRVEGRLVGLGDAIEVSRLTIQHPMGTARLRGRIVAGAPRGSSSGSDELAVELTAKLQSGQEFAAGPLEVEVRWAGPWPADGLPAASVIWVAKEVAADGPWWWPYVQGGRGQLEVSWGPEGLALRGGRWEHGTARAGFSGLVAYQAPYPTRVEVEVRGAVAGADLPWWDAFRVSAVEGDAVVQGQAGGPWTASGRVQVPPGTLLGVPSGAAVASVAVDFTARRLTFQELRAAVGSGLLEAGGEVSWGPGLQHLPDDTEAWVRLDARGRIEEVAADELWQAAAQAGLLGPPSGVSGASRSRLTGSVRLQMAWAQAARGLEPTLVALQLDGPDGSATVELAGDGSYSLDAELVNLAGRLMEPLVPELSGFAAFTGRLSGGRLEGTLEGRKLAWRGVSLGNLHARVQAGGGELVVSPASLSGGDVEGEMRLEVQPGPSPAARLAAELAGEGLELPLVASVQATVGPEATQIERGALFVDGRQVLVASGALPLGWRAPGDSAGAMALRVRLDEFPAALMQRLLPGWQVESGQVSGEVELSGSLASPRASGKVDAFAGLLAAPGFPGRLERVRVQVVVDGDRLRLAHAQADTPGGGKVSAEGEAALKALWPVLMDPVDVSLALRQAQFAGPLTGALQLSASWDGSLRLWGAWGAGQAPELSGRVTARGGRVVLFGQALPAMLLAEPTPAAGGALEAAGGQVPETAAEAARASAGGSADRQGARGAPARAPVALHVVLAAAEPLALEVPAVGGFGFVEGELLLAGSTGEPALEGELELTRGRLRYFGREISIERGRLIFSRSGGVRPRLKLQARTTGPEGAVNVSVEGDTATGPVVLASDPPMEQERLVRLLLPPASAAPGAEAPWVRRINEQLAAWAMVPLERAVRQALGLDELWLVPVAEEQRWALRLGKYLRSQGLFVRYGRSLGGGPAGQELELSTRVSPQLSVDVGYSDVLGVRLALTWEFQF